jgi:hypothetical protein
MPASSSESTQPLSTPTAIVIHPTEGRTLTPFGSTGTTPSRHWVLTLPSRFEEFYRG